MTPLSLLLRRLPFLLLLLFLSLMPLKIYLALCLTLCLLLPYVVVLVFEFDALSPCVLPGNSSHKEYGRIGTTIIRLCSVCFCSCTSDNSNPCRLGLDSRA